MAIADVPVCPLDASGTGGTATGTFLPFLFQALQSDGAETVIRSVDAVGIEGDLFHAYRMAQDRGKVKRLWTVRQLSQSIIGVAVDVSFQVKFFLFDDIKNITRVVVNFTEHFVDESVKIHWKFLNCVNNTPNPPPVVQSWTVYKVAQ